MDDLGGKTPYFPKHPYEIRWSLYRNPFMQAISDKLSQSLVWQKRLQDPFWVEFCNSEFPPPSIPSIYCAFSSYSGYDQMQLSRDRKSQPCTSSHQKFGPPIVLTNWGIMSLWKDRVGGRWQVSMADVIMPFTLDLLFEPPVYSWHIYIYIYTLIYLHTQYVWYTCKPHRFGFPPLTLTLTFFLV